MVSFIVLWYIFFFFQKILKEVEAAGIPLLAMSTLTEDGVMDVKKQASASHFLLWLVQTPDA